MPTPQDTTDTSPIAPSTPGDELCALTAIELARRIRQKQVSARDVMTAHLARIERVNPKINAIVTLVADRAMADAAKADEQQAHGRPLGPLHGLPVAHKDLVPTAGIRTTFGSPFYKDNVPTKDALIVTRIRAAGAITLGKTNTPEFGAGSNTFNPVFGATHNPYNLAKTVGGSSGGAAASLTTRHGADRRRQRYGRIAAQSGGVEQRRRLPAVAGPRAARGRHVVAALDERADGAHRGRRRALPERDRRTATPPIRWRSTKIRARFRASARPDRSRAFASRGSRTSAALPFEPEITRVVNANRHAFEQLGCVVEDAEPDFTGVDEAFPIIATSRHITRTTPRWRASIPTWSRTP